MFENISRGEFNQYGSAVFRKYTEIRFDKQIQMQTAHNNTPEDAEFVAYCLNLQQRYDISKLEEVVNALENSNQVIENLIASKRIVNLDEALAYYKKLLKEIKK